MRRLACLALTALALLLTVPSCTTEGDDAALGAVMPGFEGLDSLYSADQVHQLAQAFGQRAGWYELGLYTRAMTVDTTLSKDDFVRGLKYGMSADTAASFQYGLQEGLKLAQQAQHYRRMGIAFDQDEMLEAFLSVFNRDSLDQAAEQASERLYAQLDGELAEAVRIYKEAKIGNGAESQANIRAGRAYIDSLRTADPDYVVTASGVAYKITSTADGDKLLPNHRIKMRYVAKTLDGRIFDQAQGSADNLRPVTVSSRPKGLAEALLQMSPATKAIVVVPGAEAYGLERGQRYGLGPNEAVIFEIEVLGLQ